MLQLSFYSAVAILIISSVKGSNADPVTRIVGGTDAPEGAFPYQASMRISNSHYCGGTILNKEWIITAGHCIRPQDKNNTNVVVGTNSRTTGGDKYNVDKIIVHPDYKYSPLINDLALLHVSKEIEFNDKVQPMALPDTDTKGGDSLLITGWGVLKYRGQPSEKLQMINETALTPDQCKKIYPRFRTSHICVKSGRGKGTCNGDSGGPAVNQNSLAGIVSFSLDTCANNYPDGLTRVYYFLDWITKHIS